MTLFPDVNVLIALFDAAHQHHGIAYNAFSRFMRNGWASSPMVENGFLRIVSNPGYPNSLSVGEASGLLSAAIRNTPHRRLPEDVSLLDPELFRTSELVSFKEVSDLFLIGMAVRHDVTLVTFDRTMPSHAVIGFEERHLMML